MVEIKIYDIFDRTAFDGCCNLREALPGGYAGHGKAAEDIRLVNPLCLSNEGTALLTVRVAEKPGSRDDET